MKSTRVGIAPFVSSCILLKTSTRCSRYVSGIRHPEPARGEPHPRTKPNTCTVHGPPLNLPEQLTNPEGAPP